MIETPQVLEFPRQLTAIIPLLIPRAEIQMVKGAGLREVVAAVKAQGIAVTGPWLTHDLRRPLDTFDFEISVPVAAPVTPVGSVKAGQLPAGAVARTVYHGRDDGLSAGWANFEASTYRHRLTT